MESGIENKLELCNDGCAPGCGKRPLWGHVGAGPREGAVEALALSSYHAVVEEICHQKWQTLDEP